MTKEDKEVQIQKDKVINYHMKVTHEDGHSILDFFGDEDQPFPIDRNLDPQQTRDYIVRLFKNVKEMDLEYYINPELWNDKFANKINI